MLIVALLFSPIPGKREWTDGFTSRGGFEEDDS
jgi:hypothetical protein